MMKKREVPAVLQLNLFKNPELEENREKLMTIVKKSLRKLSLPKFQRKVQKLKKKPKKKPLLLRANRLRKSKNLFRLRKILTISLK